MRIEMPDYTVVISEPEIYIDNFARGRSGHMSHAMTEFAPGSYIEFNANCSDTRYWGHGCYGWIEYRIATDYGRRYSEAHVLPFSWQAFMDCGFMVSVEKAVTCSDGSILAFCLRNDVLHPCACDPWLTPYAVRSRDAGVTWEEPYQVSPYPGRIYDALTIGERVIFLQKKSPLFLSKTPDENYSVFISEDNGKTFREVPLPIDPMNRGYGDILYDPASGILHAYTPFIDSPATHRDPCLMDHAISRDAGDTWELCEPCYLDHKCRNPQSAIIDGVYVMHGRGVNSEGQEQMGLVFYTSIDGFTWSPAIVAGEFGAAGYYSHNLVLTENGASRLLIGYSENCEAHGHPHDPARVSQVDVMHRFLTIERN